jgi:CTP synthase
MQQTNELLEKVSSLSDEHEYYTPIPKGYVAGKTKYVFVFGTVMSGLGKGIFSASLAKIMQDKGLKVEPLKMEGYLNLDSGTLNPFRHGEVFVLKDGMETDMDLGTYERMLGKNLTKDNFMTSGQILTTVLQKERKGDYLGRDVQIIPHVTGEIKYRLRSLALKSNADVVFVEVGGTVGDFENASYIEALRELAYEEGKTNVCFVALTYVLSPKMLGEQKSKAAQLGIRKLIEYGIQPDFLMCRCANPVTEKIREKLSIYTNVPLKHVVSMHDVQNIYLIPQLLEDAGVARAVLERLGIVDKVNLLLGQQKTFAWKQLTDTIISPQREIVIGITGKYTSIRDSYASVIKAVEDAGLHYGANVKIKWIETTAIDEGLSVEHALSGVHGVIVPGGFGKRGVEGKIKCVRYLRENNIPYLGLCYGFQMAVVEFARNVCGLMSAHTTEVVPECGEPVIDILPEQKAIEGLGGNMRLGEKDVLVKEGTKAFQLYGCTMIRERFRHRFECNPKYLPLLESKGLVFSGKHPQYDIMQILELPGHKFFVGSQFHPEFTSKPLTPNPLYMGFIKACLE